MTEKEIPTCCVTGAIAGDGGACGDCDPCILGERLVPASVKRLISEKNSLLTDLGELRGTLHETLEALKAMTAVAENQGARWRKKLPDGNSPLGLAQTVLAKAEAR